jgi:hypothetical protein
MGSMGSTGCHDMGHRDVSGCQVLQRDFWQARDPAAAIFITDDRASNGSQPFSKLVLRKVKQMASVTKLGRTHGDQRSYTVDGSVNDRKAARSGVP